METPEIYTEKLEMTFEEMLLLQSIMHRLKTVDQHKIIDTYSFKIIEREKETFESLLNKIANHKPF